MIDSTTHAAEQTQYVILRDVVLRKIMKTDRSSVKVTRCLVPLVASQAYRRALPRVPRARRRRGAAAARHSAATYVRTHTYIASGQWPVADIQTHNVLALLCILNVHCPILVSVKITCDGYVTFLLLGIELLRIKNDISYLK